VVRETNVCASRRLIVFFRGGLKMCFGQAYSFASGRLTVVVWGGLELCFGEA
jgi:hypothetical protein